MSALFSEFGRSNKTAEVKEYEGMVLPVVSIAMKYVSKKLVESGFAL